MLKNRFFTIEKVVRELGISKQTLLRYEKKRYFLIPGAIPFTAGANIAKRISRN